VARRGRTPFLAHDGDAAAHQGRVEGEVVEAFQAELRRETVGEPTILKTLTLLQGILPLAGV